MDIEERVNYYIGNLKSQKWEINLPNRNTCSFIKNGEQCSYRDVGLCYIDENFESNYPRINEYMTDAYMIPMIKLYNSEEYFKSEKHSFLMVPGDVSYNFDCPIISKTRPVGESYNIIINLDGIRHWNDIWIVNACDIPFKDKDNKLIWRGDSNGYLYSTTRPTRLRLTELYWNHPNPLIDIGFRYCTIPNHDHLQKSHMSIETQLRSKFLISLEGGDVATNLKWMLYSNSVVLMPKPTMVSWAMEDKLKPWVHYVPLEKGFEDVEEKYNWCLNNLDKCEEISNNGRKYIEQFLDPEKEKYITSLVLKEYTTYVKNIQQM